MIINNKSATVMALYFHLLLQMIKVESRLLVNYFFPAHF